MAKKILSKKAPFVKSQTRPRQDESGRARRANRPLIGAHVGAAGGLFNAIENARRIGAECIQIFGASPRQWGARIPTDKDVSLFKSALKTYPIPVYLHAAYLVNLASPIPEQIEKSIVNLSAHLKIAQLTGARGLIFHIGSGKEMPKEKAMALAIKGMKAVLKNVKGDTQLIIENTAGGGQKIGSNPEDIGVIMRAVNSPRVKACFDTAHAFEGGTIKYESEKEVARVFDLWDKHVGLKNLVALHANDSKTEFNSRHDRHENIGKGYIGLQGFKNLVREKRLSHTAWLLEVPGFDNMGPDKKNVDILKSLFTPPL